MGNRVLVPKHRLVHQGQFEFLEFKENMSAESEYVDQRLPKALKLVVELPTVK